MHALPGGQAHCFADIKRDKFFFFVEGADLHEVPRNNLHLSLYKYQNLGSIVKRGLVADSFLDDNDYINSGNPDIKERRKTKKVPSALCTIFRWE